MVTAAVATAAAAQWRCSPCRSPVIGTRRVACFQKQTAAPSPLPSLSTSSRLSYSNNSKLGFLGDLGLFKRSSMALPLTVCIGDLHGYALRLRNLWRNLELYLGSSEFATATIIFLGDYCDRGPDTAGVLDFLVSLPTRFPRQTHVFLAGNHDFGFSAFLGLVQPPQGFNFSSTWEGVSEANIVREGWWSGPAVEDMHLQGRRWAGRIKDKFNVAKGMEYKGSIYDAEPTFTSYGVEHGDREGLAKAVPESHKNFLKNLLWIHEQEGVEVPEDTSLSYSKLIAVHAGLDIGSSIKEEIELLKKKDPTRPKLEALSGRKNVWNTPKELEDARSLVVSGHHGKLHIDRYRMIIDESGGMDHLPLAAVVLPLRTIIRDTDDETKLRASTPPMEMRSKTSTVVA